MTTTMPISRSAEIRRSKNSNNRWIVSLIHFILPALVDQDNLDCASENYVAKLRLSVFRVQAPRAKCLAAVRTEAPARFRAANRPVSRMVAARGPAASLISPCADQENGL